MPLLLHSPTPEKEDPYCREPQYALHVGLGAFEVGPGGDRASASGLRPGRKRMDLGVSGFRGLGIWGGGFFGWDLWKFRGGKVHSS